MVDIKAKLADVRSGKLSAVDNITHYLAEIERTNTQINAILSLNPHALEDAAIVDAKIKAGTAGRLAGLVFAIKSNINVQGLVTNCASKTLANYVATYDADVIVALKKEDAIIIGMTNMDEFACGGSGEHSAFGKTDNPAAPGHIPGGSSSGSAAAVAAGYCDIALGSDTGGSIRNPASHCGIFGVKPSYGRVSRYGLIDLSMSLDQIGPLCTDQYGCELVLEILGGKSENDAITKSDAVATFTSRLSSKNMRVGVSSDFEKLCVDKRIYHMMLKAYSSRMLLDIELKHVDLAIQTYYPLVYVELFSGTRKFDGRKYGLKIESSCGDEVLRRILGGAEISKAEHDGKYYKTALAVKHEIAAEFAKAFETVDAIILPTTPILPHKFGSAISVEAEYAYDAFTIPANLAGCCAGVVPVGTIDGIPVGVQVYAKNEEIMFAVMAEGVYIGKR